MKKLITLLALCCLMVTGAWADGAVYTPGAPIDILSMSNGSSQTVLMYAAGNGNSGFVYVNKTGTERFNINGTQRAATNGSEYYEYTLTRNTDGTFTVKTLKNNKYLPGWPSTSGGNYGPGDQLGGNGTYVTSFNAAACTSSTTSLEGGNTYTFTANRTNGVPVQHDGNIFSINNDGTHNVTLQFCTFTKVQLVAGKSYSIKSKFSDKTNSHYLCESGSGVTAATELPSDDSGYWTYIDGGKFQNLKYTSRYLLGNKGFKSDGTGTTFTFQTGVANGTVTFYNGSTSYAVGKDGKTDGGQYSGGTKQNTGDWTTDMVVEEKVIPREFPETAETRYVTIENKDTSRDPFLYNDIQYADEYTLQAASVDNTKNGYTWKVTSDGEGNITVLNAESGKGINPKSNKYNSGSIDEFQLEAGANAGYYDLIYGPISTDDTTHDRLNATRSGFANQAGIKAVTTWHAVTGHHNDNEWKFNILNTEGLTEYTVSVTQPTGCRGYAVYNNKKAADGGFFLASGLQQTDISAGEVSGYIGSATLNGNVITVTYVDLYDTKVVFDNAHSDVPYRIPAVGQTKDGDLIFVVDYRYSKQDIGAGTRLDLRYRKKYADGHWGEIKTLAHYIESPFCAFGDPCIVCDRESNRVMVTSCCGNVSFPNGTYSNHQGWARWYSNDGGETWESSFTDLAPQVVEQLDERQGDRMNAFFIGSGKISQSHIIKKDQYYRLYCASNTRMQSGKCNFVWYSDDFGATWNMLGTPDVKAINGGDEPKADELPDGSVVISSRDSGRIFNIFHYTDYENAEGYWGTQATSSSNNSGCYGTGCNGEILIVPVMKKSNNAKTYLALQSIPADANRNYVSIYWKELTDFTKYRNASDLAPDWTKFQVSTTSSAYSTMCQMQNGHIAFFYEENLYNGGYDMVYKNFTVEDITNDLYEFYDLNAAAKATEKAAYLSACVGTYFDDQSAEVQALADAYEAEPTMENYDALNAALPSSPDVAFFTPGLYQIKVGSGTAQNHDDYTGYYIYGKTLPADWPIGLTTDATNEATYVYIWGSHNDWHMEFNHGKGNAYYATTDCKSNTTAAGSLSFIPNADNTAWKIWGGNQRWMGWTLSNEPSVGSTSTSNDENNNCYFIFTKVEEEIPGFHIYENNGTYSNTASSSSFKDKWLSTDTDPQFTILVTGGGRATNNMEPSDTYKDSGILCNTGNNSIGYKSTMTVSVQSGYKITGYTFKVKNLEGETSSHGKVVTTAGQTINTTAANQTVEVSGLHADNFTITLDGSTGSYNEGLVFTDFYVTYEEVELPTSYTYDATVNANGSGVSTFTIANVPYTTGEIGPFDHAIQKSEVTVTPVAGYTYTLNITQPTDNASKGTIVLTYTRDASLEMLETAGTYYVYIKDDGKYLHNIHGSDTQKESTERAQSEIERTNSYIWRLVSDGENVTITNGVGNGYNSATPNTIAIDELPANWHIDQIVESKIWNVEVRYAEEGCIYSGTTPAYNGGFFVTAKGTESITTTAGPVTDLYSGDVHDDRDPDNPTLLLRYYTEEEKEDMPYLQTLIYNALMNMFDETVGYAPFDDEDMYDDDIFELVVAFMTDPEVTGYVHPENYKESLAAFNKLVESKKDDIIMPQAGHAFRLSVRSTNGRTRWYLTNDGGVSTDKADAAVFVMGSTSNTNGYGTLFASNDNTNSKYLQYKGATGTAYGENTCDFEVTPMVNQSNSHISADLAHRFGTFSLKAKARPEDSKLSGVLNLKEENQNWDKSMDPFMNGTFSSAIELEEVEYPYTEPTLATGTGDGHTGVWASVWLPFPMNIPDGIEVYKGTQERTVDGDPYLGLTKVDPDTNSCYAAGGYLLYSTTVSAGTIDVLPANSVPTDARETDDAAFVGSTENPGVADDGTEWTAFSATFDGKTPYVLANKSNGVGFYKYVGTKMPKGKAIWLKPADSSDAECVKLGFDDIISAIEALHGNTTNAEIYDLQGHRLDKVEKGQINVINGQKIMFK